MNGDSQSEGMLNLEETNERHTVGIVYLNEDECFTDLSCFRTDVLRRALLEYERKFDMGEVNLTVVEDSELKDAPLIALLPSPIPQERAVVASGCVRHEAVTDGGIDTAISAEVESELTDAACSLRNLADELEVIAADLDAGTLDLEGAADRLDRLRQDRVDLGALVRAARSQPTPGGED
jgi:hypothetical protein